MTDIKLSDHFHLSEFTTSQTAARMGRKIVVDVGDPIFTALEALCRNILEPVREQFGTVIVSSGFRPFWLNSTLPGTAEHSQHMDGEAADFTVPGKTVEEVVRWIAGGALPFDKLIWEFDAWVHCSYRIERPGYPARRQVLTAKHAGDGKPTLYLAGLVPFTEAEKGAEA